MANAWISSEHFHELAGGYKLPSDLYHRLFPHQRDGVEWMWTLHNQGKIGGILGDDMGMGKTIQVIAYLCGLFISGKARKVLIGMPLGLLETWKLEFRKWFPNMRVKVYHGPASAIQRDLDVVVQKGGVILTTYDKIRVAADTLTCGGTNVWDYVILDEGHQIKNPSSQKTKAVYKIQATHKLLLSGTPIQNNMEELWTLFDYVSDGRLLSTKRNFMKHFGKPIKKGEARDATPEEKQVGNKIAEALRDLISPFFIRREKTSLLAEKPQVTDDAHEEQSKSAIGMDTLGAKHEFAIWIALSEQQIELYEAFLTNLNIQEILNKTRSPLNALGVLRKICDHPALLSSSLKDCGSLNLQSVATPTGDYRTLVAQSAKLSLTMRLIQLLRKSGHRMLIVASSRILLDILEKCIVANTIPFTRIDGTVIDRKERQRRINMFNGDPTYSCFLLTTQVAIGITLTGADRVIMYDPSWNPKRDAQAVDRAYRVGQNKDVIVYRLLTCGTMEEKVYRNQIRKDYLARTAMEAGNHTRYFTQSELKDMFILGDTQHSETQLYLSRRHPLEDDQHYVRSIRELEAFKEVKGVSRHDQLYSAEDVDDEDEDGEALRLVTETLSQFTLEDTEPQRSRLRTEGQKARDGFRKSLAIASAAEEHLLPNHHSEQSLRSPNSPLALMPSPDIGGDTITGPDHPPRVTARPSLEVQSSPAIKHRSRRKALVIYSSEDEHDAGNRKTEASPKLSSGDEGSPILRRRGSRARQFMIHDDDESSAVLGSPASTPSEINAVAIFEPEEKWAEHDAGPEVTENAQDRRSCRQGLEQRDHRRQPFGK
ncbi:SNF2 family N-terminal domain-containing protein [Powellomyces hirtus]|nr:SNF2 family N-terminal domain-containing protein [Powellomyces hirtus]